MATNVRYLTVNSDPELTRAIADFTIQGFVVASREPGQVTLRKDKEFSTLWAVVGFFVCLLPFLIYLIVYAAQKDEIVVIQVQPHQGSRTLQFTGSINGNPRQYSPDGNYWWDGAAWQPVAQAAPQGPMATPPPAPHAIQPISPTSLPQPTPKARPRLNVNLPPPTQQP